MAASRLRLAVFTAQAPWGRSEPFVLTEIAELQRRVEAVLVIPARPESALFHGELAQQVGRYAMRVPVVSPAILISAIAALFRSPGRVTQAFVEAVRGSDRLMVLFKNLVVFPKAVYVARLVRRFGAHHIHAHWAGVSATMALVVSRLTGVPWSFTAHRWDIAENNLLATKVRSARFGRVISRHGRDEILGILGVRECPKLLVMHMGTGVPERPADGPPERVKVFRIACIANLVEKKGHRYLIEACRLLRERGCRFVCHIVGDGPLRGELEALARTYGLRDVVHFLGPFPHDRVMKMFREHEIDLMALPSIIDSSGELEGIPVALMEALAYGIPAISTETGGIPELLGDGAGALVKPADAQALTDAIQRIMEDSEYRATLIETGYARVSADFNIQTVADRLVELMESPCGGEWADGAVER